MEGFGGSIEDRIVSAGAHAVLLISAFREEFLG